MGKNSYVVSKFLSKISISIFNFITIQSHVAEIYFSKYLISFLCDFYFNSCMSYFRKLRKIAQF